MNKFFLIALVVFSTIAFTTADKKVEAQAATINWMTFEEAVAAQKTNPKKIMLDAYTNWCGPCKMLDKNTFQNPDVVKYVNENFYAVKFNAEGNESINFKAKTFTNPRYNPAKANSRNSAHQLTSYYKIQAYPTILFLDEEAGYLTALKGYRTPQQLELFLKLFATNDYKTLKEAEEWENYQNSFNYTFK